VVSRNPAGFASLKQQQQRESALPLKQQLGKSNLLQSTYENEWLDPRL
jgi:hypothetical protein